MSSPFQPTRWTLVQRVQGETAEVSRRALNELCEIYWTPLYVYARGLGKSAQDAEDLVQGFLASGVERSIFSSAEQEKGKMRTFLLTSFKRFMRDEWSKQQAIKRGGGNELIDFSMAEDLLSGDVIEPAEEYDRRWAIELVEQATQQLRNRYQSEGKETLYQSLLPALSDELLETYAEIAEKLEMSVSAVKVAVHRLRKRYAETLREEVRQTLGENQGVDEELRYLVRCLARDMETY